MKKYMIFILLIALTGCETSPSLMFENQNSVWKSHDDGSGLVKLVDNGKYPHWVPGTKDMIAFARFQGPKVAICIADYEGKNQVQLTAFDASEYFSWSPDRNWIAFATDRHGKWEIYKVNVNTKQEVRLTNNQFNDKKPRWSPKGNKIAFQSDRRNGDWDIWIMDVNGTNQENLTNGAVGDGYDGEAVWSPDGDYIAHMGNHIGWGGPKICIAVLPTATNPSATGPVSKNMAGSIDALWSPSGDYFFYVDTNNNLYKHEISSKQEQIIASITNTPSATDYMDCTETTVFFVKGVDLYGVKWRVGGEWKVGQGYNPAVY